jgi:hypothetical protein
MEALIDKAKRQVKNWYNIQTPREWIETDVWSVPPDGGQVTRIIILRGGEPKGTIIANYAFGVVVCWDMCFNQSRIFKMKIDLAPGLGRGALQ